MEIVNQIIQFFISYWYAILTIIGTTVIVPILLGWQLIIRRTENKMAYYNNLSIVVDRVRSKQFEPIYEYFSNQLKPKISDSGFPMNMLRKYILEFERIYGLVEKKVLKIDDVCKEFNYELVIMKEINIIEMYKENKARGVGDYELKKLKKMLDYNKSLKNKKN